MTGKTIYITGGSSGIGLSLALFCAVTGMAQALRQEMAGTGVGVNLICPSEVNTPMIEVETETAVPQTRFLKDLVGTLEPEVAARQIASGLRRQKAFVIPGFRANIVAWTAQHFPGLSNASIDLLRRWKF